ncbi:MAG: hypothetical protein GY696_27585, partial [Gammaproteobacteria bacterium]|nr:hypothetical protein [Gammaproteobacteria bacterium]
QNLFNHVRPGGVIALSLLNGRPNWMYDYPKEGQRKYRFNLCKPSPTVQDTEECRFHFIDSEGNSFLSVPYYHYANDTYTAKSYPMSASWISTGPFGKSARRGKKEFPPGFWKEFEEAQPCIILTARRPRFCPVVLSVFTQRF